MTGERKQGIGDAFAAIARASAQGDDTALDGLVALRQQWDPFLLARVRDTDAKSQWSRSHSEDVCRHAVALGDHVGITPIDRHWLAIGALLHDVGYSVVFADAYVAGTMTPGQRRVQHLHCVFGDEMLEREGFPRVIRDIVRYHHERWDGAGYPDQLARDEIPRLARITAIAERYTALCSPRGDRPGLDRDAALAKLLADEGAFDPQLIKRLTGVFA